MRRWDWASCQWIVEAEQGLLPARCALAACQDREEAASALFCRLSISMVMAAERVFDAAHLHVIIRMGAWVGCALHPPAPFLRRVGSSFASWRRAGYGRAQLAAWDIEDLCNLALSPT